jgi:hypothetical protein
MALAQLSAAAERASIMYQEVSLLIEQLPNEKLVYTRLHLCAQSAV